MTEQVISLLIKITIIVSAWVFAQIEPLAEYGISQGFDQAFSIGLMMLFLVYMILENRKKDNHLTDKQDAYVDLLQKNQQVIAETAESQKDVSKTIERSTKAQTEALNRLTSAFEKLEQKL